MDGFTTFDIAYILEMPRERLQEWVKKGFIKPSIETAKGQGTKNLFSYWDLIGFALFDKIVDKLKGGSRTVAKAYIEKWQEETHDISLQDRMKVKIFCVAETDILLGPVYDNEGEEIGLKKFPPVIKASVIEKFNIDDVKDILGISSSLSSLGRLGDDYEDWQDIHLYNVGSIIKHVEAPMQRCFTMRQRDMKWMMEAEMKQWENE
ncbi:hypothetical protein ACFL47_04120 [Candidatus Latescibacterota bacterium]